MSKKKEETLGSEESELKAKEKSAKKVEAGNGDTMATHKKFDKFKKSIGESNDK